MQDHITNNSPSHCSVAWEVSNKCNYSCWYCPEHLHSGTSGWPDFDSVVRFFNDLSTKHTKLHIDLVGGEPTMWPRFNEFVNSVGDNIDIELTTNGSRTLKWWKKLSYKVRTVAISVHFDTADINHIRDVCELIKDRTNVSVMMLFDPKHRNKIVELSKMLEELNVTHYAKYILPNFDDVLMDYTQEEIKFCESINFQGTESVINFKPTGFIHNGVKKNIYRDVVATSMNNFEGWKCRAGNKRFHIDFAGEVFAGSCRSYRLGNINDAANIDLSREYVICNNTACTCVDDIRTEKWN